ncbi:MAG: hypothetical protein CMD18_06345 [Flavobacteriales bacterium]|nr:hypothetical protein [Flavobacteriales bacterium]|tara:strand:- start:5405 stop:6439 length:1035 start_codon:yes stop_codon:yes gene_type:complete
MSTIKSKRIFLIIFLLSFFNFSFAQDPCLIEGVNCNDSAERNGLIFSFIGDTIDYAAVGTSMPFWVGVGDVYSRTIDTSVDHPVAATVLSGPGLLTKYSSQQISPYSYFNSWEFSSAGNYKIEFSVSGILKDTVIFRVDSPIDLCSEVTEGCTSGGGDIVFMSTGNGGIIPVDAIFPLTVGVKNRLTGQVDSSFFGYVYLNQLSGPGTMYGTKSMYGERWLTFTDLYFSKPGTYLIEATTNSGYLPDTVSVEVVSTSKSNISNSKVGSTNLFPNPFSDKITIENKFGDEIRDLKIYNIRGKLIDQYPSIKSPVLSLAHLPEGIYFFEVGFKKSSQTHVSVLVKR